MIARFARPVPVLSMTTNTVLDYIYVLHGHRITHWNDAVMSPPQLQVYTNAISASGPPPPLVKLLSLTFFSVFYTNVHSERLLFAIP